MFCEKCGKEIADDSQFCEFCGASTQCETEEFNQSYITSNKDNIPQNNKRKIIILIVVAVIIAIIAVVFLLLKPFNEKTDEGSNNTQHSSEIISEETGQSDEIESTIPSDAIEYDGHHYKIYNEAMYWSESRDRCEEENGHLATVTSREEQVFLEGLIEKDGAKKSYWLGGTDETSEGNWTWITGESWEYSNWREGQPNNRDNVEVEKGQDYLELCCGSTDVDRYMLWWDATDSGVSYGYEDYPDYKDTQYHGYICEWEE